MKKPTEHQTSPPNKSKNVYSVTFSSEIIASSIQSREPNQKNISASKFSIFGIFTNWQEFATSAHGFLFTFGVPILAVATFIVLCQFDMSFTGGMVLAGAVFGDIILGVLAANLQKHGLFSSCSKTNIIVADQNSANQKP